MATVSAAATSSAPPASAAGTAAFPAAGDPDRSDRLDHDVTRAVEAYLALGRARDAVHHLQRALLLGDGDPAALDAALDAAVVSYRAACAGARRCHAAEAPGPSAEERLAGWLAEAARNQRARAPGGSSRPAC